MGVRLKILRRTKRHVFKIQRVKKEGLKELIGGSTTKGQERSKNDLSMERW